jgi:hypothetical protein
MSASEARYFDDVDLGDEIGPLKENIANPRVMEFMKMRPRLAGDGRFTDPVKAREMGLKGMIVPGPLSAGLLAKFVQEWAPNGALDKLDIVFRRNVVQDTPIELHGVITDTEIREGKPSVDIDLLITDATGDRLVTAAATVVLPQRSA